MGKNAFDRPIFHLRDGREQDCRDIKYVIDIIAVQNVGEMTSAGHHSSNFCRTYRRVHFKAKGVIGEPQPPVMFNGGAVNMNSYTRSSAQSSARSFK